MKTITLTNGYHLDFAFVECKCGRIYYIVDFVNGWTGETLHTLLRFSPSPCIETDEELLDAVMGFLLITPEEDEEYCEDHSTAFLQWLEIHAENFDAQIA